MNLSRKKRLPELSIQKLRGLKSLKNKNKNKSLRNKINNNNKRKEKKDNPHKKAKKGKNRDSLRIKEIWEILVNHLNSLKKMMSSRSK